MAAEEESLRCSSSDPCPICLAPFTQESYLDQCFHKFCYNCIVKWINIVTRGPSCASSSLTCPLCKKITSPLILVPFDEIEFDTLSGKKILFDAIAFGKIDYGCEPFSSEKERTSPLFVDMMELLFNSIMLERVWRIGNSFQKLIGDIADKLRTSLYWKFRKYLQQNIFLADWLRREIQAVIQDEDVDIIMHHVIGVIDSLRRDWVKKVTVSTEAVQREFRTAVSDAVRPFLTGRTERFVQEIELFLASGLNIDAFDKVYIKHLGWKNSVECDDDDEGLEPKPAEPYLYFFDQDPDEN